MSEWGDKKSWGKGGYAMDDAIDIKSAFLHSSQIQRPIYQIPPTKLQKENNIWKLNSPVCGLNDAA